VILPQEHTIALGICVELLKGVSMAVPLHYIHRGLPTMTSSSSSESEHGEHDRTASPNAKAREQLSSIVRGRS
jgi:hypothetical protein